MRKRRDIRAAHRPHRHVCSFIYYSKRYGENFGGVVDVCVDYGIRYGI